MRYTAESPWGPVVIEVTTARLLNDWQRGQHYDDQWARQIVVTPASPAVGLKVNRTQVRFKLYWRVMRWAAHCYAFTRDYTWGSIHRMDSGAAAPMTVLDTFNAWVNPFIDAFLAENPQVLIAADGEGWAIEAERLRGHALLLELQAKIAREEATRLDGQAMAAKEQQFLTGVRLRDVAGRKITPVFTTPADTAGSNATGE